MSLVWRKLKRSRQDAYKYRFVTTFQELLVEAPPKWQPDRLRIVCVRKRNGRASRRIESRIHKFEPGLMNPLRCVIVWPVTHPEFLTIETTLYRDKRTEQFDDKEWLFCVEEVAEATGKCRILATVPINMRFFRGELQGTRTEVRLRLQPCAATRQRTLSDCVLQLLVECTLVQHGSALDDDMQSISSEMSTRMPPLVAQEDDFDRGSLSEIADDELGSPLESPADVLGGKSTPEREADAKAKAELDELLKEIQRYDAELDEDPSYMTTQSEAVDVKKKAKDTALRPLGSTAPLASFDKMDSGMSLTGNSTLTSPAQPLPTSPLAATTPAAPTSSYTASLPTSPQVSAIISPSTSNASHYNDLHTWARSVTQGYNGVDITNFTTAWRNGLAFAAVLHHHRPDLIDFDSLKPDNIRDNCSKAFAAARQIGVDPCMEANDMVVQRIPDSIAVVAFVFKLQQFFTAGAGDGVRSSASIQSPLSPDAHRLSLIDYDEVLMAHEMERAKLAAEGAVDMRGSLDDDPPGPGPSSVGAPLHSSTPKPNSSRSHFSPTRSVPYPSGLTNGTAAPVRAVRRPRRSSGDSQSRKGSRSNSAHSTDQRVPCLTGDVPTPLMTREQLRNPFDDEDDGEQQDSARVATTVPRPEELILSPAERQIKEGARRLLDQFTREHYDNQSPSGSVDSPSEEQDVYKTALKRRARALMEEAKEKSSIGRAIRISDTVPERLGSPAKPGELFARLTQSAPQTRQQTPVQNGLFLSPDVEIYQYKPPGTPDELSSPSCSTSSCEIPNKMTKSQSCPPDSTLKADAEDSPQHTALTSNRVALRAIGEAAPQAFDRTKRFGSMKAAELSAITAGWAQRIKTSYTIPKELTNIISPTPETATDQGLDSSDVLSSATVQTHFPAAAKIPQSPTDLMMMRSAEAIEHELRLISRRQAELDQRASQCEKKWRFLMNEAADSKTEQQVKQEQDLANEFLTLLNERNQLTRREYHLQLLQKSKEIECNFQTVNDELRQLISIDECDKTEKVKRDIDDKMTELVSLVDKRDEIARQLINSEQGTEDDEQYGIQALQNVSQLHNSAAGTNSTGYTTAMEGYDKQCAIM